MKCPKCGSELPQNALFCEKCATEIKIVPEYEAKLEEQISISLENVASIIEEEKGPAVPISSAAEVLQKAEEEAAIRQKEDPEGGSPYGNAADALGGATMILPSLSDSAALEGETVVLPGISSGDVGKTAEPVTKPEENGEGTLRASLEEEVIRPSLQEERLRRRGRRSARYQSRRRFVKFTMVFLIGALVATCVLVLFYARDLYGRRQTQSYYVGRAYQFSVDGEYEKAAEEIQKAIELCDQGETGDNGNSGEETQTVATLYLLKAEYLQKAGEMDLALGAASMGLEDDHATEEEEIAAYGRMIGIYASQEEYAKIATLLSTCTRQQVIDNYLQYSLFDPEFSLDEGTYEEPVRLQLTDQGEGSIFYTMDGSRPTTESFLYTGPIELSEGTFTISAIYVNHFNLSSNVITRTYIITGAGDS